MSRSVLFGLLVLAVVVSGQTWKDLYGFPWKNISMSFLIGLTCPNTTCFVSGSNGQTQFGIYYTNDSFKTLNQANIVGNPGWLVTTMAHNSNTNMVAAGLGALYNSGVMYTEDALNWHNSSDINVIETMDIEPVGGKDFAFVGTTNLLLDTWGVAYSKDGGKSWAAHNWGKNLNLPDGTQARYGAFINATTWYVSGGNWPSPPAPPSSSSGGAPSMEEPIGDRILSHVLSINGRTKRLQAHLPTRGDALASSAPSSSSSQNNGYYAVITKTMDGGATWTKVFEDSDNYYFNDICCFSDDNCFVVSEGFLDGNAPGARIFATHDAGHSWTQVYNWTESDVSFQKCHMVSDTEAWVAGSSMKSITTIEAIMFHTVDGGKTWKQEGIEKGITSVADWSFINSKLAFATAYTELGVTTILEYS